MVHLIKNKKLFVLMILPALFLSLALIFFQLHCDMWIKSIGVVITFGFFFVGLFVVLKLARIIDLSIFKIVQPFYLAVLTVSLMFHQSADFTALVINMGVFVVVISLILNELKTQHSFFERNSVNSFIYVAALIIFSLACFIIPGHYNSVIKEIIHPNDLFHTYYFLSLITFFLLGVYKIKIPYGKIFYSREYLIIKVSAAFVVFGKALLALGYCKDSFAFLAMFVAAAVVLLLCFRQKKEQFVLISLLLILLSFVPGQPKAQFIDPAVIAFLIVLSYFRSPVLLKKTSKFGQLIVSFSYKSKSKIFLHNGIVHGTQHIDYDGGECKNTYYTGVHKKGALLSILHLFSNKKLDVAVLGLGAGMVASLAKKGDNFTFYEIDPAIKEMAIDSGLFTYVEKSKGNVSIEMGHARKSLAKQDAQYDLLIVDAYIGKKVVSEFLTIEAFEEYFRNLKKDGLVLVHLSSGGENHESTLASLSKKMNLNSRINYRSSDDENYASKITDALSRNKNEESKNKFIQFIQNYVSNEILLDLSVSPRNTNVVWAVFSRNQENLGKLLLDPRWQKLQEEDGVVYRHDRHVKFAKNQIITEEIE